jgi:hypothetical protein
MSRTQTLELFLSWLKLVDYISLSIPLFMVLYITWHCIEYNQEQIQILCCSKLLYSVDYVCKSTILGTTHVNKQRLIDIVKRIRLVYGCRHICLTLKILYWLFRNNLCDVDNIYHTNFAYYSDVCCSVSMFHAIFLLPSQRTGTYLVLIYGQVQLKWLEDR